MNKIELVGRLNKPPIEITSSMFVFTIIVQNTSGQEIPVMYKTLKRAIRERVLKYEKGTELEVEGFLVTIPNSNRKTGYHYCAVSATKIRFVSEPTNEQKLSAFAKMFLEEEADNE